MKKVYLRKMARANRHYIPNDTWHLYLRGVKSKHDLELVFLGKGRDKGTEVGGQVSEIRGRKSEVGGQGRI